MLKIPIHSVTDLITNSSTTIFTYSEGSEPAVKEMVDELFKTFGINKTCDEVFDTVVLCDEYRYTDFIDNLEEDDDLFKLKDQDLEKLVKDVQTGKVEKPEWFKTVEEQEDSWNCYLPDTYLHLIPKDEKYKELAKKIESFLYSTDHEATRDG